jgi:hypothetical protein
MPDRAAAGVSESMGMHAANNAARTKRSFMMLTPVTTNDSPFVSPISASDERRKRNNVRDGGDVILLLRRSYSKSSHALQYRVFIVPEA